MTVGNFMLTCSHAHMLFFLILCGLQFSACNILGGSSYVEDGFMQTASGGGATSSGGSCTAGTATAADVLAGITFPDGSGGITTGTMTNNGSANLSTTSPSAAGYYSGFTNGSPTNTTICSGTTILGTAGSANCLTGNRLTIETAADGSGSAITTGSGACLSTQTLYAVLRDNSGAFASNPSVSWYVSGNNTLSTATGSSTVMTYKAGTSFVAASVAGYTGITTQSLTVAGGCGPSNISGLQLWFAADTGVTVDGANGVSAWVNQSTGGGSITQAAAGNRPVRYTNILNSLPIVRFTAGNRTYIGGTIAGLPTGSAARTVIGVMSHADPATGGMEVGGWGSVNAAWQRFGLYLTSNTLSWEVAGSGSQKVAVSNSNFMIFSSLYNAGSSITLAANAVYKNGTEDTIAGSGGTPNTVDAYFEFGRIVNFNGAYWSGDMAEFVVFDSVLSTLDRQTVECYFSSKYNIALGHGC